MKFYTLNFILLYLKNVIKFVINFNKVHELQKNTCFIKYIPSYFHIRIHIRITLIKILKLVI